MEPTTPSCPLLDSFNAVSITGKLLLLFDLEPPVVLPTPRSFAVAVAAAARDRNPKPLVSILRDRALPRVSVRDFRLLLASLFGVFS